MKIDVMGRQKTLRQIWESAILLGLSLLIWAMLGWQLAHQLGLL
ncbi:hypothetical protein Q8W71_20175 [Methylobacterium sp. NEAU 140]|nr:hypothetical protein [Methylobacterium sp. NEAU 140]MDP4024949.1 hypothetical protein [Methylobacterium sp. NEAU 140]